MGGTILLGVALIGVVVGAVLMWKVHALVRAWTLRRRSIRGAKGEEQAEHFLRKHGFKILCPQVELPATMFIDGKPVDYTVRADFLVRRKGRTGVVEVKTGTRAVQPSSRDTRRQIFEYYHLFNVDDFFFFDAESQRLMSIRFGPESASSSRMGTWMWGCVSGVTVTAVLVLLFL